jgi:serine/threonine-protein kinase
MIKRGSLFAERYHLERLIGRGGMGAVWVARDDRLGRLVAIKFMEVADDEAEEATERFQREAAATAQLRTRHVVEVFDHGVSEGRPYIVMELLEGQTLAARLRGGACMTIDEVASLLHQLVKGLRGAHAADIVHRDLKPQNIYLALDEDGDDVAKILDFGIAKLRGFAAANDSTKTGTILGSPHYMAPEQARAARDVDQRADVWSLGVIAYRGLTGRRPWESEAVVDLLVRICTEPMTPASHVVPELSPEIDAFFEQALRVDPAQRFASVDELLSAFLEAADVVPPPRPSLDSLPQARDSAASAAERIHRMKTVPLIRKGAAFAQIDTEPIEAPDLYGESPSAGALDPEDNPTTIKSSATTRSLTKFPLATPRQWGLALAGFAGLLLFVALLASVGGNDSAPPGAAQPPLVSVVPEPPPAEDSTLRQAEVEVPTLSPTASASAATTAAPSAPTRARPTTVRKRQPTRAPAPKPPKKSSSRPSKDRLDMY